MKQYMEITVKLTGKNLYCTFNNRKMLQSYRM